MERAGNLSGARTKADSASPTISRKTLDRIGIGGMLALISYLIGFIPAWLWAKGDESERESLQSALRPGEPQNALGSAAINARRGEYELSRRQASEFFAALREDADRDKSAFNATQLKEAKKITAGRDEIIAQLAGNEAAAVDRLTNLYFAFMEMRNSPPAAGEK